MKRFTSPTDTIPYAGKLGRSVHFYDQTAAIVLRNAAPYSSSVKVSSGSTGKLKYIQRCCNKIQRTTTLKKWNGLHISVQTQPESEHIMAEPDPNPTKHIIFQVSGQLNLCYVFLVWASLKKTYKLKHQSPEAKHTFLISVHTLWYLVLSGLN